MNDSIETVCPDCGTVLKSLVTHSGASALCLFCGRSLIVGAVYAVSPPVTTNKPVNERARAILEEKAKQRAEDEAFKRRVQSFFWSIFVSFPRALLRQAASNAFKERVKAVLIGICSTLWWATKQLALGFVELRSAVLPRAREEKSQNPASVEVVKSPNRVARMAGAAIVTLLAIVLAFNFVVSKVSNQIGQWRTEWTEQAEAEQKRIDATKVWVCADCRMTIFKSDSEYVSSDAKNSLCSLCFKKRVAEQQRLAEAERKRKADEEAKRIAEERRRLDAARVWICANCGLAIPKSNTQYVTSDKSTSLCIACGEKRRLDEIAKEKAEKERIAAEEAKKKLAELEKKRVPKADVTVGGYIASPSEELFDKAVLYLVQKDNDALQQLLDTKLVIRLKADIPVEIMETKLFRGKIKIRPRGQTIELWTFLEAVKRE